MRNSLRYFRSTSYKLRYPTSTVLETTQTSTASASTNTKRLPGLPILQQQFRHHQHQQTHYSSSNETPQSPIKASSSFSGSTESDNDVTPATVPAVGEESILKEPPSTTANTTFVSTRDEKFTTIEQKPRPIFPWRHDITPIPRLIPGTQEFVEARTAAFQNPRWQRWTERVFAHIFLDVRIGTLVFSFNSWKQSLAHDCMYAFTKGVAGIVSNTYRIPVDAVSSEVKDLDILSFIDDNDDDTTPMIHFNYPPDEEQMDATALTKEFNDDIMSILNELFNSDKIVGNDDENLETKNHNNESTLSANANKSKTSNATDDLTSEKSTVTDSTDTASDQSSSTSVLDNSITFDKMIDPETISVKTKSNSAEALNSSTTGSDSTETISSEDASSSPSENGLSNKETTSQARRHPAFLEPYSPKTYDTNKTESSASSDRNSEDQDEFCSNIGDMMIEPLRKLYESAHESGRDQLKIKLHMRPINAEFISLFGFLNLSRNDGPEKVKDLWEKGESGFRPVFDHLYSDMVDNDKAQTTIEVQVWITCLESFQVLDSQTGVVLQGSKDGLPQEVTHVVRLERTLKTTYNTGMNRNSVSMTGDNWKITDIDDMLGHKAWYIP